jgi:hypothetical protein
MRNAEFGMRNEQPNGKSAEFGMGNGKEKKETRIPPDFCPGDEKEYNSLTPRKDRKKNCF